MPVPFIVKCKGTEKTVEDKKQRRGRIPPGVVHGTDLTDATYSSGAFNP